MSRISDETLKQWRDREKLCFYTAWSHESVMHIIDEALARGEERDLLLFVVEFLRNADWMAACIEAEEWAKRAALGGGEEGKR